MQNKPKVIVINELNGELVSQFVDAMGASSETFRYFNSRPLSIIKNHIFTCVVTLNEKPVGYGHLDKENNIIWLGCAVIESMTDMGIGSIIVHELITFARENFLHEIFLSVDVNNKKALHLYNKFGFGISENKGSFYFMRWINH